MAETVCTYSEVANTEGKPGKEVWDPRHLEHAAQNFRNNLVRKCLFVGFHYGKVPKGKFLKQLLASVR